MMNAKLSLYQTLEVVFGRRLLMKAGRFLFLGARRELLNSPEVNGEYALIGWALPALLESGSTTHLDVGANLGDWSAQLLHHPQGAGHTVHAFEPAPAQHAHIAKRLEAEGDVGRLHLHKLALADRTGTTSFLVTGDDSGNNAIATDDAVVAGKSIEVKLSTLDDFASQRGLHQFGLVKVDTEGNDYNVIAGAINLLRQGRISLLQFEYNWRWVAFDRKLHDVFKLVADLDCRIAKITQNELEIYDAWHHELETYFETNFVIIKHGVEKRLPHSTYVFDPSNIMRRVPDRSGDVRP